MKASSRRASPVVSIELVTTKRYAVDVTGGGRSAEIIRKMSVNRSREMAAAIWKAAQRARPTTFAPTLISLERRQRAEEVAEAVGERVKLKANGFGGEGATRKPCPIERDFQLGFPPPRPFA
jgi:diacylglycerol kinase family enzyme